METGLLGVTLMPFKKGTSSLVVQLIVTFRKEGNSWILFKELVSWMFFAKEKNIVGIAEMGGQRV